MQVCGKLPPSGLAGMVGCQTTGSDEIKFFRPAHLLQVRLATIIGFLLWAVKFPEASPTMTEDHSRFSGTASQKSMLSVLLPVQ
jgi:hypothetical protein